MPYSIQRKNRFNRIQFREPKMCLKRRVLGTFLKEAISKFFCSNGLDMMLFDSETHFLLFFPRILNKNVFFLRLPVRLKSSLLTFQNVKNSLRRPPLMRPKSDL